MAIASAFHRPVSRRALLLGALASLEALILEASTADTARVQVALDERSKVAHLLRRAGFGFSPAELEAYVSLGYSGAVDRLLNYEAVEDDFDRRLSAMNLGLDLTKPADMQQWWLLRMLLTPRPLQEKIVLFWHGFLTSGLSKVGGMRAPLMLKQNEFFREHALADFRTILQGVSKDPAMMIWLDVNGSKKAHPNENYARELMELFTIGVGHYTEEDVREAARAFTGWSVTKDGEFSLAPRQHDDGVKQFLGQAGPWKGEDIVDRLVEHPATGPRLARKLWTFFAYRDPDDQTLRPLVDAYYGSGFSLRAMLAALFTSEAFTASRAYRAQVKSPVEFVVGLLRALEVETDGKGIPAAATRMGQTLFNPPNVAGWPGGTAWLNSGTWLERLNFVNRIVTNRQANAATRPVHLERRLQERQLVGPEQILDDLLATLVDGRVGDAARAVLLDYLTAGGTYNADTVQAKDKRLLDERVRGVAYLIMAMPEFHLN